MADLTGGFLVCARPWVELSPHDAEKTDTTLTKCSDCNADVYAVKKNLGRGLTILCYPCAKARTKKAASEGEPCLLMGGEMIGHKHEDEIFDEVKKLEKELKGTIGGQ